MEIPMDVPVIPLAFGQPQFIRAWPGACPGCINPCRQMLHGKSGCKTARGWSGLCPCGSAAPPQPLQPGCSGPFPAQTSLGWSSDPVRDGWGSLFPTAFISCDFPLEIIPAGGRAGGRELPAGSAGVRPHCPLVSPWSPTQPIVSLQRKTHENNTAEDNLPVMNSQKYFEKAPLKK